MFQYFRFAFRHLWKNKLFSIINIVGLSLGLACCFIILLHVRFETGFDRFHKNKDRIIRVLHDRYAYTPIIMATEMPGYFSGIEKIIRIGKFDWTKFYVVKDNEFVEDKDLVFSDPGFFDVFLKVLPSGILEPAMWWVKQLQCVFLIPRIHSL
jgi:putative ABC transport system permease protein